MFLARRLLLGTFVFLLADFSTMAKIGCITGIQIAYLIILIVQRPFTHVKDQIIEILNESMFLVMIIFLFMFNDSKDWEGSPKYLYLSLIVANFTIIFLITTSKNSWLIFLVSLILAIKAKRSKTTKVKQIVNHSFMTEKGVKKIIADLFTKMEALTRLLMVRIIHHY